MKKKVLVLSLIMIIIMVLAIVKNHGNSYAYDENNLIINPLWEEYNSLSEEEKETWESIPEQYVVEFKAPIKKRGQKRSTSEAFNPPSSYDLRNVEGVNYVTPMKNQSSLGLCWAFATVSSLETNILKLGLRTPDNPAIFAENQIDYISANPASHTTYVNSTVQTITEAYNPYHPTRMLGSGGNFFGETLTSGVSVPYQSGIWGSSYSTSLKTRNLKDVFDMSGTDYIATDYVNFPYINNQTASEEAKIAWRNLIKEHIMNYGSTYVTIIAPQRSSSYACYVYYTNTSDRMGLINWTDDCRSGSYPHSGTHAMSIIGWDDNYTQSYCALPDLGNTNTTYNQETCEANGGVYRTVIGAWILKNSWGNSQTYNFVHLAYDSRLSSVSGIKRTIVKDFDNTYNTIGPKTTTTNSTTRITEQKFYKSQNIETLKRISFTTNATNNTTYEVYLINEYTNKQIKLGTVGPISIPGRYSIDVNNNHVLIGSSFKIKIIPSNQTYSDQASAIYVFTNNTVDDSTKNITTVNSSSYSGDIYSYNVTTRTSNTENATKLTFEITDQSGIVQPLLEGYDYGYTVANADTTTLESKSDLRNGLYHIKTYADGNLMGIDAFSLNISLTGGGTETSPYLIQKIEDFDYMFTSKFSDKYFKLANDIDLSDYDNFTPINSENFNNMFTGTLDGDNHAISNLTQNTDNAGFFASISGTIKNLNFKNVDIIANTYGGVLAAEAEYANISNVSVEGTITAGNNQAYIGGIVGMANNTTIEKSYNKATINGGISGSFVGDLQEYSGIINSFNLGLFVNPSPALSSFAGNIAANHNTIAYLIDYSGKEHNNCYETLNQSYDNNELIINNVYYYKGNTCEYLGNDLDYDEMRDINSYVNFDNTIWNIEDNLLPTLINNPIILTYSFDIEKISNVVVNQTYNLDYVINPNIVTYPNIEITSSDTTKADFANNKITTYKPGLVTFTISALDGSHTKKSIDIYVFDVNSYTEINNESFITFETKNALNNQAQNDGIVVEASSTIGTGATVTYKKDNEVISTFKVIIKGDLNGDGNNNSLDLSAMLNHISGKKGLKNEYLNAAQLNSDVNVNSLDLAYLLNKIAGKAGY